MRVRPRAHCAPWRRASLATRLGLSFGVTATLVLVCVAGAMYVSLTHALQESEETELRADLQLQMGVLVELASQHPPGHWQQEWQERNRTYDRFAWQLLSAEGRVRAASSNADAFRQALAHAGQAPHRILVTDSLRVDGGHGRGATLRGFLDVSRDRQMLDAYGARLLAVVLAAIGLSSGLCRLIVRQGLLPLHAMNARVAAVGTDQLATRIADAASPAELHQLATVFDGMLARLAHAFDALARFSSDLAHEFRAPINNLVTAASVTLARQRDLADYQEAICVVVDEGARLSRMVAGLLFLSRVEQGQQPVHCEPIALAAAFQKLIAFFELVADDKGVTLVASGEAMLDADPALLQRALSSLLTNALTYTGHGGTVRLLASCSGSATEIAVVDDGAGIAAEHLPFVFDRFYRADPSRSPPDSTGLGLAIVRSIMTLHGGSIEVASIPGKGTRFTLRFPSKPPSGPLHPVSHEHSVA